MKNHRRTSWRDTPSLHAQHSSQTKVENYLSQMSTSSSAFHHPHHHQQQHHTMGGVSTISGPGFLTSPVESISGRRLARSMLTPEERERVRKIELRRYRIRQAKIFGRKFLAFLFSHIGFSLIVICYVILGGFIFKNLEIDHEIDRKRAIIVERNVTLNALLEKLLTMLNEMRNLTPISGDQEHFVRWFVSDALHNYTQKLVSHIQNEGWNGKFEIDDLNWTFEGSLLYAVTVITTIGYGHAAPKTHLGRLLTMLYALLGIPLTFLWLSTTGDAMATVFKIIYAKMCVRLTGEAPTKARSRAQKLEARQKKIQERLRQQTKHEIQQNKSNLLPRLGAFFHSGKLVQSTTSILPTTTTRETLSQSVATIVDRDADGEEIPPGWETSDGDSVSHRKFYCKMNYLPSRQKEQVYEDMLKQSMALRKSESTPTVIPVLNWRDIDSELEVVSMPNKSSSASSFQHASSVADAASECPSEMPPYSDTSSTSRQIYPSMSVETLTPSLVRHNIAAPVAPDLHPSDPPHLPTGREEKRFTLPIKPPFLNAKALSLPQNFVPMAEVKEDSSIVLQRPRTQIVLQNKFQNGYKSKSGLLPLQQAVSLDSVLFGLPVEKQRKVSYLSEGWSSQDSWNNDSLFSWERRKLLEPKVDEITVPLTLSLALLTGYILLGAVVFIVWEGNDFLKWAYFCFITLSTIGFGDIVPGTKIDSNNPKEKMIILALYVAFGLALVAMCFKLMQEEVLAKLKKLAKRVSLLIAKHPKPPPAAAPANKTVRAAKSI